MDTSFTKISTIRVLKMKLQIIVNEISKRTVMRTLPYIMRLKLLSKFNELFIDRKVRSRNTRVRKMLEKLLDQTFILLLSLGINILQKVDNPSRGFFKTIEQRKL